MKAAIERVKAIPGLVKQVKANLQTPPQIYTETAIKQFPGIMDFYKVDVPKLIEPAPAEMKSRFQAEWAKAVAALEDYQSFLQTQLLPKSTGNFRRRAGPFPAADIDHEFQHSRAGARRPPAPTLRTLPRDVPRLHPFYRVMYPNINLEQLTTQRGEEEVRDIVIQGVFDKIKVEHPTRENFMEHNKATVETLKNFFEQTKLIDLPDTALNIEAMPLASQGIGLTRLLTPGAYETGGAYTVDITPLPAELTDDQAKDFLEEYNDFYAPFWTARHIYPGSFVPGFFTNKSGTLMRKLHPSMPLYKGWPVYVRRCWFTEASETMTSPAAQPDRSQLKIVMDFQLELNVHQAGMTKEQAISYMTKRGFQTPVEAALKWNRILLAPCEAAYAYVGIQEIWDMEKDYKS
jgi:hypothetical protein